MCHSKTKKQPGNARSYKIRQSGGEGELLMFPCICRLLLPMSFEMNISSNQHHTVMHQSFVNWPSPFSQICCYLCLQHAISNDAKGRSTTTTTTTNNTSEKKSHQKIVVMHVSTIGRPLPPPPYLRYSGSPEGESVCGIIIKTTSTTAAKTTTL